MTNDINIRPAKESDRDAIWKVFQEVIAAGDTYPIDPEMSREDAFAYWFQTGASAFVAEKDGPASATLRRGKQRSESSRRKSTLTLLIV